MSIEKMFEEDNYNLNKTNDKTCFPMVSILLAVYKPNYIWLIEQLKSLNKQTYENVELLVYDDCPEEPVDEKIIEKYTTNFKYTIIRGKMNQGSNKAFEELTKMGRGEFFAYCDQDDIWEKEKISVMVERFLDRNVTLVCSDLSIIDEHGKKIANSITKIRKRHKFKSGSNLSKDLLIGNFVTGCAMMVKKNIAKKAIPFEDTLIHDQWIAIIAAINGKIEFINKPLVQYRQHGFNQTGILKGIYDKQSYYNIRIQEFLNRFISIQKRLHTNDELSSYINYCILVFDARKKYFLEPSIKNLKNMIKHKKIYKLSIMLEILMPIMPECIFKFIIRLTKNGVL